MKSYLLSLGFIFLAIGAIAQTATNKLGLNIGGGFQQYHGDLGSALYKKYISSYGTINISVGYYLTKSVDACIFGFIGDYGYCQPEEMKNKEVPDADKCIGCVGRVGMGNLNSRIASGGVFLKYKIANGFLLSQNAKLKPHIYGGVSINRLTDRMKKKCIAVGDYYTVNAGLGLQYYLCEKVNIGYNIGFGYFTTDKIDFISRGKNDLYMQNTLNLGIDLF